MCGYCILKKFKRRNACTLATCIDAIYLSIYLKWFGKFKLKIYVKADTLKPIFHETYCNECYQSTLNLMYIYITLLTHVYIDLPVQLNCKAITPQAARRTNTENLWEPCAGDGIKLGLNPKFVSGSPKISVGDGLVSATGLRGGVYG